MNKIDIHTHILPAEIPAFKKQFGYGGFIELHHKNACCAKMMKDDGTFFRDVESRLYDPLIRIQDFSKTGVTKQVLSTVPVMFSYWTKPEDGLSVSKVLNDHIADVVRQNPERFWGLGTVPLQSPDLAVRELRRCMEDLKLSGVQIGTNINGKNLGDKEFFEFFKTCEDLGAAVFLHPWNMMGEEQTKKYWLPWLVGMPAELNRALSSLIFSGTLETLPDLRLAAAHGGGSFGFHLGRLEKGFHGRPDLCAVDNPYSPKKYLKQIMVDSLVHDPMAFKFLLELFGEDQISLGSDYPFPLGEENPGEMIKSLELKPSTQEKIFYKNALRWLGEGV